MYLSIFCKGCTAFCAETPKFQPIQGIVSSEFYFVCRLLWMILTEDMIEQASYLSSADKTATANHYVGKRCLHKKALTRKHMLLCKFQGTLVECKGTTLSWTFFFFCFLPGLSLVSKLFFFSVHQLWDILVCRICFLSWKGDGRKPAGSVAVWLLKFLPKHGTSGFKPAVRQLANLFRVSQRYSNSCKAE